VHRVSRDGTDGTDVTYLSNILAHAVADCLEEDVAGFQIPVDEIVRVQVDHAPAHVDKIAQDLDRCNSDTPIIEFVLQRAPAGWGWWRIWCVLFVLSGLVW
jgi:hypothetical protein